MSAERWDGAEEEIAALDARLDFADRALRGGRYVRAAEWIDAFVRRHRVYTRRAFAERPRVTPIGNLRDLLAHVCGHAAAIVVVAFALAGCGSVVVGPSSLVSEGPHLEVDAAAPAVDAQAVEIAAPADAWHEAPAVDAGAVDVVSEAPPAVVDAGAAVVDVGPDVPCYLTRAGCPIGGR